MNKNNTLQISIDVVSDQKQVQNFLDFKSLEQRQIQNRYFNHEFHRFSTRKNAICEVLLANCNRLSLKRSSFALSLAIFDASISLFDFPLEYIANVAQVALKMAVKINETEPDVLLDYFLRSGDQSQRLKEVRLEEIILKNLNYKVHFVTCFHFLEVFLRFDDVAMDLPSNAITESFAVKDFSSFVYSLNVVVSSEYKFNQFTSLSVAVAVIMIARFFCEAETMLPDVLETITGLESGNVQPILELIVDAVEGAMSLQN